jgi:hypothetical protein
VLGGVARTTQERCSAPDTQTLALHVLTTFISLFLLFYLLKDPTLYDINKENHNKNTKQPLDLSYMCFVSNNILLITRAKKNKNANFVHAQINNTSLTFKDILNITLYK